MAKLSPPSVLVVSSAESASFPTRWFQKKISRWISKDSENVNLDRQTDFTLEKSWPYTLTFHRVPLNQWSPEKYIGRHTITFANFQTVLSDFFKLETFLFENHPFLASSYPFNSIEEKSDLFSEANFAQEFFQIFMSHYHISPFGKRYKITLRVITCLFVEGYGILV